MRLGIDVGGTNTDAVLMHGRRVVAEAKTPTTPDVTSGIVTAIGQVMSRHQAGEVDAVMIGTTHFTNAVVEARHLMATAVVRLGLPATQELPPMVDWPERLRIALGHHVYICHGGHEFDGRHISELDPAELIRVAEEIGRKGIRSIAISSVFSPINGEFEEEAGSVLSAALPGVAISLSSQIGRLGLLERENATVLNACLRDLADHTVQAFQGAIGSAGINAPLYLSQNDGTLMAVEQARRYPVATFASGPTNSMRGAAFLTGLLDCAVIDIGGTTSDVGTLQHGFPRPASVAVEMAEVRTNFRMPDVYSFGIGGGSVVRSDGALAVGPESVGYELPTRALCFGGQTLTATDVAVAAGLADVGNPALVRHLDRELVRRCLNLIQARVAQAVDRMRTSAAPIPVVVVGGGSILLGDRLPGASVLVRPEQFAVANAIGAAIAQVGGEVDQVFTLGGLSRDTAVDSAKATAVDRAVAAGADPATVQVVDVEDVPLSYLPGNAVRVRVKAVGDLRLEAKHLATGG